MQQWLSEFETSLISKQLTMGADLKELPLAMVEAQRYRVALK